MKPLLCGGAHTGDANAAARVPLSGYLQFKYQTLSRNLPLLPQSWKVLVSQAAQPRYVGDKQCNLSLGKGKSIINISKSLTDTKILAIETYTGNLALRAAFPHSQASDSHCSILSFSPPQSAAHLPHALLSMPSTETQGFMYQCQGV